MSQPTNRANTGIYAPLVWKDSVFGALSLDSGVDGRPLDGEDLKLAVAVAHQTAMAIANHRLTGELRENAEILQRLLTSFSSRIRNTLLDKARAGKLRLGGEKSEVALLCSDIRGFTRLAASMDSHEVVDMLNDYFRALTEAIFRNDGTIDKFLGDGILAVFGSPEVDPERHVKAVRAAYEMQQAVKEVNQARAARGEITCEMGIGLHCGEVLHGFIGSAERMEFTVIGDAVNKTSRYCAAAEPSQILLSPDLHQRVWQVMESAPLTIATKHEGPLRAFQLERMR